MGAGGARKRKWRRWASVAALVVVLIAGSAWYAYTAMTDKLVEVLTDGAAQGSDLAGSVEGAAAVTAPAAVQRANEPKTESAPSPDKRVASAEHSHGADSKTDVKGTASNGDLPASKEAEAVTPSPGKKTHEQAAVSPEAAASAAGHVTVKDRLAIGKVLLDHWDAADLKAMSAKLKGGLTIAEKRELKQEALGKLKPEEYDRLIAIAQKLGLSRGKGYADSIREQETNP